MVSNHVALHWSRNYKEGFRPILIIIVDDLLFLDFLGLLVANGLVINHIGYRGNYHLGKVQLLTYNSMAWILCGYVVNRRIAEMSSCLLIMSFCRMIHALLSIEGGVAIIKDKFPKRGSRCMDCNRNIGQRKDPGAADDAHHALLGDEEYRDEADTAGT